jgi:hypothetical protein
LISAEQDLIYHGDAPQHIAPSLPARIPHVMFANVEQGPATHQLLVGVDNVGGADVGQVQLFDFEVLEDEVAVFEVVDAELRLGVPLPVARSSTARGRRRLVVAVPGTYWAWGKGRGGRYGLRTSCRWSRWSPRR